MQIGEVPWPPHLGDEGAGQRDTVLGTHMLSAAFLALEEPGFRFIVGSKPSEAPYDLADHFERQGNAFDDGQTIETTHTMGTGKKARDRRVVWQWSFKRYRHDNQAISAMVDRRWTYRSRRLRHLHLLLGSWPHMT